MLFYSFPTITCLNDVLPHIAHHDEFIVARRDAYTVINYVVSKDDTFSMDDPDDLGAAIRRDCRGLIFDREGKLVSRPLHKFFNVNEREETQTDKIDMNQTHFVMEKMDGSMVRPLLVDGNLFLATKMGITDIALDATSWTQENVSMEAQNYIIDLYNRNFTPIFEWIGPGNKIVINYDKSNLVLLAIRNNVTGSYESINNDFFDTPNIFGNVDGTLKEYLDIHRKDEGREGFVIRFLNGHMLKCKNDWYCLLHKTKDIIRTNRHVLNIILDNKLDDILPLLDANDVKIVRTLETSFWQAFNFKYIEFENLYLSVKDKTKKEIALDIVPFLKNKSDSKFLFAMFDGKSLHKLLISHCLSFLKTNTKCDELLYWLGI